MNRNKSVVFVKVGDDSWTPSKAELEHMIEAFQQGREAETTGMIVPAAPFQAQPFDGGTAVEAYTHFNNGGMTLRLEEQQTEYGMRHSLHFKISNMGMASEFSIPVAASQARAFKAIAEVLETRTDDPSYMSLGTYLNSALYGIDTVVDGQEIPMTGEQTGAAEPAVGGSSLPEPWASFAANNAPMDSSAASTDLQAEDTASPIGDGTMTFPDGSTFLLRTGTGSESETLFVVDKEGTSTAFDKWMADRSLVLSGTVPDKVSTDDPGLLTLNVTFNEPAPKAPTPVTADPEAKTAVSLRTWLGLPGLDEKALNADLDKQGPTSRPARDASDAERLLVLKQIQDLSDALGTLPFRGNEGYLLRSALQSVRRCASNLVDTSAEDNLDAKRARAIFDNGWSINRCPCAVGSNYMYCVVGFNKFHTSWFPTARAAVDAAIEQLKGTGSTEVRNYHG